MLLLLCTINGWLIPFGRCYLIARAKFAGRFLVSALVLLTLIFALQFNICAEETGKPLITIEAEAPDENGIFDLVVSMENAHFIVYELGIKYDKTAVMPVCEDGTAAESFEEFALENTLKGVSYIGCELDNENGMFLFTGYVNPGSTGENLKNKMIYLDEKTELYRFSFKVLEDKDFGFDIASIYNGDVYSEFFKDGAIILSSLDDEKRYVADIVVKYGEKTAETETPYYQYSELYPNNFTKEQRLAGTVYVVNGDYAAAVDGVLFAVDSANKSVVPYEKDEKRYLPLRFICESLGYLVGWNEFTECVTVTDPEGFVKELDTKTEERCEIVHDRTMVTAELLTELVEARIFTTDSETVVYTGIPEWTPDRTAEKEALDAMRYVMLPFFRMFI